MSACHLSIIDKCPPRRKEGNDLGNDRNYAFNIYNCALQSTIDSTMNVPGGDLKMQYKIVYHMIL